jgi:hypothetical protein
MAKKKKKKTPKKKRPVRGTIYITPDGGETIYVQRSNGERGRMVSQSQIAQDIEQLQTEEDMHSLYSIQLRRKYPTLQKAWEKYQLVWNMVANQDHDD